MLLGVPLLCTTGTPADSLSRLGLSRDALLSAGLPQHTINALYRAMAAHAGGWPVASQVVAQPTA